LKDAVDLAYRKKYNTPGSIKYVRDLNGRSPRPQVRSWRRFSGELTRLQPRIYNGSIMEPLRLEETYVSQFVD